MAKLQETLQDISSSLEIKMRQLLPEPDNSKESILLEAILFSVLSPGKRLRPFLTIAAANLFGVCKDSALQTAAAIEFIHNYSLIHDDLPAMDNDLVRRGQPTCHVKFGEATAILAGDSLLTLAFGILASPTTHTDSNVRCELIAAIAKASGPSGMTGGQMLDILSNTTELSLAEIIRLQRMKTGELFAVSCEAGAILGKSSKNLRLALKGYAHALGLAFQITDDLMDLTPDKIESTEPTKLPINTQKVNYILSIGPDTAFEQVKYLVNQAISHLNVFEKKADILREFANFILERKY
ncbi:Farnesyl diphosphate synthase [Rickettsiales bacterium Ac37b]|nr:Farnesyl diphosphate synthase [Rickettsiales bacterium Ac37b]